MPPKKRRRPRGEGAFYQRASDGMWIGAISYDDEDGERRRATVSSADKATAIQKFRTLRQKIESGDYNPRASMTVEQWMTYWVEEIVKPNVRPNTYRSYRGVVANQIVKTMGTKRLPVRPADIRANLKMVLEGWSPRTAELTHFVWTKSMDDAVKEGVIARSPAEHVAKPKGQAKEGQALTSTQARKVLLSAMAAEDPMVTRWAAAFLLGARQGELLGLERTRIDLDTLTIELSWQLQSLPTKPGADMADPKRFDVPSGFEHRPLYRRFALTRPKTARSKRIIPLPAPLAEVLRVYLESAPRNRYGLVWTTESGTPIPNKYDSDSWHAALARAGVPDVPLHAARHTTATLLQEMGVEEQVRMQIMGHSSVAAHRGYTHVDLALARKALGNLDGLLELG